jgi:hypothetical protein
VEAGTPAPSAPRDVLAAEDDKDEKDDTFASSFMEFWREGNNTPLISSL